MIENVRVSEKAKNQLITLKRRTGIQNWNVLCRWAFCLSLAEPTKPPAEKIPSDSNVDMTWKTFTGGLEQEYWTLLLAKAMKDDIQPTEDHITDYFRLHLHRGISYLFSGRCESLRDLNKLTMSSSGTS